MKNLVISANIKVYDFSELGEVEKKLVSLAQEATKRSYAPYSNFQVGAAVLLANGEIITGTNQENAAYPSGLCAERTTLFYANSQYPEVACEILAIAAFTNGDFVSEVLAPCGSCSPVILESEQRGGKPMRILLSSRDTVYEVDSIKDLLPLCFEKSSLGK
ncbi:MAG: cytidine deaminase [Bacteroidales bacterium]